MYISVSFLVLRILTTAIRTSHILSISRLPILDTQTTKGCLAFSALHGLMQEVHTYLTLNHVLDIWLTVDCSHILKELLHLLVCQFFESLLDLIFEEGLLGVDLGKGEICLWRSTSLWKVVWHDLDWFIGCWELEFLSLHFILFLDCGFYLIINEIFSVLLN